MSPTRSARSQQVPRTLSGKVLEVPVKRILMGVPPEQAASIESLADPHALDYFTALAEEFAGDSPSPAGRLFQTPADRALRAAWSVAEILRR